MKVDRDGRVDGADEDAKNIGNNLEHFLPHAPPLFPFLSNLRVLRVLQVLRLHFFARTPRLRARLRAGGGLRMWLQIRASGP